MTIFRYASQAIRVLQNNHNHSSGWSSSSSSLSSSSSSSSSEMSPAVRSLCQRLEDNLLERLELGWQECEYRYSRKEIQALCQAFYANSSLTEVTVGWRLEKSALHDYLLPAIAGLRGLRTLELAVHSHIHESTLRIICRNASLQELEIRGARMRIESGIIFNQQFSGYHQMEDYTYADVNIVGILSHVSQSRTFGTSNLRILKLVNCGIQDEHVEELCEHQLPFDQISFKRNAGITSTGLATLLKHCRTRHLDLTECGIDTLDAKVITALESSTVQELILTRNCKITTNSGDSSSTAMQDFFRTASQRLIHLDLSFCNVSGHLLKEIFSALTAVADPPSSSPRLQSLVVEGCRHIPGPALCHMLSHNQSLRRLVLQRQRHRFHTRTPQLPLAVYCELSSNVLQKNYSLQELQTGDELPNELELLLVLNKAGRRILRNENPGPGPGPGSDGSDIQGRPDWATVLSKASHRNDALYWFVRNGAGAWWAEHR